MKNMVNLFIVCMIFMFGASASASNWGNVNQAASAWQGVKESTDASSQDNTTLGACATDGNGGAYCPCSNPVQYCWTEKIYSPTCAWTVAACATREWVCSVWGKTPAGAPLCLAGGMACVAGLVYNCTNAVQEVQKCATKCP